jgi:hypothetical protein
MKRDFEMTFPVNSSEMTSSNEDPVILQRPVASEQPGKLRCEAP